jgi:hypothetical protein
MQVRLTPTPTPRRQPTFVRIDDTYAGGIARHDHSLVLLTSAQAWNAKTGALWKLHPQG